MDVTIIGNVTNEPELRFMPNGQGVVSFTVAENDRYRNASGDWVDGETTFMRVTLFREQAERVAESIGKGTRVVVHGRLKLGTYEAQDGQTRRTIEVVADEVAASLKFASVTVKKVTRSAPAPVSAVKSA